ncbi:hypothetical protein CYLTODRAFT_349681 [Cylindrobasidium torrendii FP15055 ss-10]|uniref:IgA peptidase M64 n=1 Tax=Cylindrobasidium torrendii FP15055 ss-10 TaxID=1314674 RepID=A0A0D7BI51_9AGAR|nr:hypothetical protein CYLTODRAFT_349681 [Cylindrobasidium torrendii FP15055 ss-10]
MQQVLGGKAEPPPLFISGPRDNRVNLVFFSDGYTETEKDKFLEDATSLAQDISYNQTFNTVRPLLNFWAAFTPSVESGVGANGKPKNTTYGLYRPGTELRGVYYAYPEVADAACSSMGSQCDFPILLGNDPLYGGLGGRFTVITSSTANGPQILRHELGHSIIPVGEEYDGGEVYSGVDAYDDLSEPVPWEHWLTKPTEPPHVRVERSVMPLQDYAWSMLNTTQSWSTTFVSSGTYSRHLVRMSLSGLLAASDLTVELDGEDLKWEPKAGLGLDRWHYDFYRESALSGGTHEVKFTLANDELQGVAQLCSVEILEYGDEEEFITDPGYYGVFPTYSVHNTTTYRPTNEDCLMRLVTASTFCSVCIEGLWHALLSRLSLIDGFRESCSGTSKMVEADLVALAEFRDIPVAGIEESYSIAWFKDGEPLDAFTNFTLVQVDENTVGTYKVVVEYSTSEVRKDEEGHLVDEAEYVVKEACPK